MIFSKFLYKLNTDKFDMGFDTGPVELYAFQLNDTQSTPASKITYLEDNKNFTPAGLNSSNVFSYGSWADAFFIRRLKSVMLKFDGTIGEMLDNNDLTATVDGSASNVTNMDYPGNAMVGLPTVWMKVNFSNASNPIIYISNYKLDDNFYAFSHMDVNGNIVPYLYLPIFEASNDGIRNRSISGQAMKGGFNLTDERAACQANGSAWDEIDFSTWEIINILLMLISRTTHARNAFGNGNKNSNTDVAAGNMNKRGLFWGTTANSTSGVKIFGIEHFWGNNYKRMLGCIDVNGTKRVKLCRGRQDGSTADDYNGTGAGYIDIGLTVKNPHGNISSVKAFKYGIIPAVANGSSSETDYCAFEYAGGTNVNGAAIIAGYRTLDYMCSPFSIFMHCDASFKTSIVIGQPICRPS